MPNSRLEKFLAVAEAETAAFNERAKAIRHAADIIKAEATKRPRPHGSEGESEHLAVENKRLKAAIARRDQRIRTLEATIETLTAPPKPNLNQLSVEAVRAAVNESQSFAECLRALDVTYSSANITRLKTFCKTNNISVGHYRGSGWRLGRGRFRC